MGKLKIDPLFLNKLERITSIKNNKKVPNNIVKGTQNVVNQQNIQNKTYKNDKSTFIKCNQDTPIEIKKNQDIQNQTITNPIEVNKIINLNINYDKYYDFFLISIVIGIGFELGSKIGFILFYN